MKAKLYLVLEENASAGCKWRVQGSQPINDEVTITNLNPMAIGGPHDREMLFDGSEPMEVTLKYGYPWEQEIVYKTIKITITTP